jgi:CO/xanthine dehydrogenase Mo-binding subunit
MDPLAFRLKNYAEVEPISGKPFSSKALRDCYAQGAERFGWERRPLSPRQMRDHDGQQGCIRRATCERQLSLRCHAMRQRGVKSWRHVN